MYLLDTDTLTHLWASHPKVVERLRTVDDPDIGITIITKVEVLRGRIDYLLKAETGVDLLKAQELLFRTEELLNPAIASSKRFGLTKALPSCKSILSSSGLIVNA